MEKKLCRKNLLAIRSLLPEEKVLQYSKEVENKIYLLDEYKKCEEILIYVSYNNEINTINLIENAICSGKKVAVPKVLEKGIMDFYYINSLKDLKRGYAGILEPSGKEIFDYSKSNEFALMICPGVAFDRKCNRVGYGGGYYDRYLSKARLTSIALAYDFQMVQSIDVEKFDSKVDIIITPESIFYCNGCNVSSNR